MFTNSLVSDDTVTTSLESLARDHYIRVDRQPSVPLRPWAAMEAEPQLLEVSPAGAFARRALSCNGVTAEFIEASARTRSEIRFRGSVHLLVVYEQGSRTGGETALDGVPPSKLRDFARRFTFVPAGRAFHELAARVIDELLPPIEMSGCTARLLDLIPTERARA